MTWHTIYNVAINNINAIYNVALKDATSAIYNAALNDMTSATCDSKWWTTAICTVVLNDNEHI